MALASSSRTARSRVRASRVLRLVIADNEGCHREHQDQEHGRCGAGDRQARGHRPPPRPLQPPTDDSHRPSRDRFPCAEAAEVCAERLGTGVSSGRVFLKALQGDRLEVDRQPRLEPGGGRRVGRAYLLKRVEDRRRAERRPAGQQFVQDRPERVNVSGRAVAVDSSPPACSGAI